MQKRQRAFGTNRDMAHGNRREPRTRPTSDSALLRQAKRDALKWQEQLRKQRRAEAQS